MKFNINIKKLCTMSLKTTENHIFLLLTILTSLYLRKLNKYKTVIIKKQRSNSSKIHIAYCFLSTKNERV